MLRTRFLLAMGCALYFSGCASSPYNRTGYRLQNEGDLLVTNSQAFDPSYGLKTSDGQVDFGYAIIAQNVGHEASYEIRADHATFQANGATVPAQCASPEQGTSQIKLAPGKKARIECRFHLVADAANQLRMKDTEGTVIIPVVRGATRGSLKFGYRLRVEDFE